MLNSREHYEVSKTIKSLTVKQDS